MLRTLIAALLAFPAALHATELEPLQALIHQIDEETTAFVFYAQTPAGFQVITTVQQGPETGPLLLRINTVLLPGQSTELAVPRVPGQMPSVLRLLRDGDTLRVEVDPHLLTVR